MKPKRTLTALLLAFMWAFAAQADEALITGKIRVGAYDVEVQNASRTNWVDGELVITYLNTDTSVAKSFTLPQATTGRLLAVGGGGAGGQDQKQGYSANYGLPGGGGAGGLVIKDAQAFDAKTYTVSVGAGGAAVARTLATINNVNTWVPASYGAGKNGGDSTVKQGTTAIVTAKGGGGGGRRSAGNAGGSGGGGSYSGEAKNGGSGTSGQGYDGGKGEHKKFGAGGGGAGGKGGPTTAATVDGSGAGGPGKTCDITGENLEYARGGRVAYRGSTRTTGMMQTVSGIILRYRPINMATPHIPMQRRATRLGQTNISGWRRRTASRGGTVMATAVAAAGITATIRRSPGAAATARSSCAFRRTRRRSRMRSRRRSRIGPSRCRAAQ